MINRYKKELAYGGKERLWFLFVTKLGIMKTAYNTKTTSWDRRIILWNPLAYLYILFMIVRAFIIAIIDGIVEFWDSVKRIPSDLKNQPDFKNSKYKSYKEAP